MKLIALLGSVADNDHTSSRQITGIEKKGLADSDSVRVAKERNKADPLFAAERTTIQPEPDLTGKVVIERLWPPPNQETQSFG